MYETNQGSGNSSIKWLFMPGISALLMEDKAIGATYSIINLQQPVKLKITTHVEYVNKQHSSTSEASNIDYSMKHDYNTWKSFLVVSGDQLAPEKRMYLLHKQQTKSGIGNNNK
jgi:hypothetical protein